MRHLLETGAMVEREGRWVSRAGGDRGARGRQGGARPAPDPAVGDLPRGAVTGRRARAASSASSSSRRWPVSTTTRSSARSRRRWAPGSSSRARPTPSLRVHPRARARDALRRAERPAPPADARAGGPGDRGRRGAATPTRRSPRSRSTTGSRAPTVDAAKAIEYSLRAGERARQLFAWAETAAHWDGALALMERAGTDAAERARLLVALADVSAVTGDLAGQIDCLERALALYDELGDERADRPGALAARHGPLADRLDLRRPPRHPAGVRALRRRPHGARARAAPARRSATSRRASPPRSPTGCGSRTEPRPPRAAMEIAERVGDEALWAGAAEAYGWHRIAARRSGRGLRRAGARLRGRRSRPAAVPGLDGAEHPRPADLGPGRPRRAQAFFERQARLSYAGRTAYGQQLADSLGRCHASRGEMAAARRRLSDAKPTWITHSLQPLVDLWDGNWDRVQALARRVLDTSRRTGNRWDEWAAEHLAARVRPPARRARPGGRRARAGARDRAREGRPLLRAVGAARPRPRPRRDGPDRGCARPRGRCREILGSGEDWRGRRASRWPRPSCSATRVTRTRPRAASARRSDAAPVQAAGRRGRRPASVGTGAGGRVTGDGAKRRPPSCTTPAAARRWTRAGHPEGGAVPEGWCI